MIKNRKYIRKRKGFTLVELLVVILILAILMAVALPLYLAAVTDAQTKTCRANMQTIANAAQAFKTRDSSHTYQATGGVSGSAIATLYTDLSSVPVCPNSGTYTVTEYTSATTVGGKSVPAGGLVVSCSATGHGTFVPGVDSQ